MAEQQVRIACAWSFKLQNITNILQKLEEFLQLERRERHDILASDDDILDTFLQTNIATILGYFDTHVEEFRQRMIETLCAIDTMRLPAKTDIISKGRNKKS